jgi:4-alpha-glucanotransferase
MRFPRASGVLLHPTSLPGRFGLGDFGSEARTFVDFLSAAGQTYWQILPLSPTGYGDSPYSALSAFAGNTLLISAEGLAKDGLISEATIRNAPGFESARADYGGVYHWKNNILSDAFHTFSSSETSPLQDEFNFFCDDNSWWLDDYAAFRTITNKTSEPWFRWREGVRRRDADALSAIGREHASEIEAERFYQFLFYRQWLALKGYANERGVRIIGDIPIFVALDAVDVWCNRDKFKLNPDGSPMVVAGVPPDYFSSTGQRWGNPIYDWNAMRVDNFGWWTARLGFALRNFDIARLDHFIGFVRNWEVPGSDETAENGQWVEVPGREIFGTLRDRMGDLPLIAEDLGAMTPEVEVVRDDFGFPGMRILHYAFGSGAENRDLPHNHVQNSVVYTGTHDNDTTVGWYKKADKSARNHCRQYLSSNGREIHWDMICSAMSSVADTAIIPMQDLLGLGSNARMNRPATSGGNWSWRLLEGEMNEKLAMRLFEVTRLYGRGLEK